MEIAPQFRKITKHNVSYKNLQNITAVLKNYAKRSADVLLGEDTGEDIPEEDPLQRIGTKAVVLSLPLIGVLITMVSATIYSIESSMSLAASLTATISLVTLTIRYCDFQLQIGTTYVSFMYLTYLLVNTNGLIQFFIIYEFFLLPSAALVWYFSPNKRGVKTTMFFLLWTQLGSILVLTASSYSVEILNTVEFHTENLNKGLPIIYQTCLVLGFLIKVPVFPFYFWLTKTHVEAVTSFSIFLSGFLVKIAIFGMFKYSIFLGKEILTTTAALSLVSAINTSILFAYQVDLKKVIAYATIQEMSQLAMCASMFWVKKAGLISIFLITHTVLSAKYFLLNDVVYRIYNTRSTLAIQGLGISSPKLTVIIVSTLALFRGLPFTIKNIVEVTIMSLLVSISGLIAAIWAILVVFLGNVMFSYTFLKTTNFSPQKELPLLDITKQDASTVLLLVMLLSFLQQTNTL